jgi:hypothetical protein
LKGKTSGAEGYEGERGRNAFPTIIKKGDVMKRLVYILLLTAWTVIPSAAPAAPWAANIGSSITLNQSAYSDNWAGSETGNVTWAFMSNSTANKRISPVLTNNNTLKLYYGQTDTQNRDTHHWRVPQKSTDLIYLESVFLFNFRKYLDPFISGRVETFFTDERDSTKTFYVNPMTITESLGLARVFIKEDHRKWTARLGLAVRENIDRNFLDPVTLLRRSNTSTDGGIEFVNEFLSPLSGERLTVSSTLIVFQAVANSQANALKGQPGQNFWKAPDVNFENIITANITKYLIVSLYTQLLYDKQITLGGRFKQTLGLGVAYNIIR